MGHPSELIAKDLGPATPQRRFSGDEVRQMLDCGLLREDDHLELIGGLLIAAEPQSPGHNNPLQELTRLLIRRLDPRRWMVRIQMAVAVDEYSEPEPDLAVVPLREARRRDSHPRRAALVVEVAKTSLALDTRTKKILYAAAGIPEYWVVDVEQKRVLVFLSPVRTTGEYRRTVEYGLGGTLAAKAFPELRIKVAELFS